MLVAKNVKCKIVERGSELCSHNFVIGVNSARRRNETTVRVKYSNLRRHYRLSHYFT